VFAVAPLIAAQLPPFSSQRDHWCVKVMGVVPVHVPFVAVSVSPIFGVPVTTGGSVFVGTTVIAASPVRAAPRTEPVATAATASTSGTGQRRPRMVKRDISSPPWWIAPQVLPLPRVHFVTTLSAFVKAPSGVR
jgi:hypothetical protein